MIYIPLESVQTGTDSIPFVYLKNGSKQIVVLGESNENNVVVEQGIQPGVQLYLNTPKKPEDFTRLLGENLVSVIKEKERIRKEEERQAGEQPQGRDMMEGRGGGMNMTPEMRQQFQNMQGDTAAMRRFREMRGNAPQGQRAPQRNQ